MMNVIWIDEIYFCLNQKPYKQNVESWSSENPHEILYAIIVIMKRL